MLAFRVSLLSIIEPCSRFDDDLLRRCLFYVQILVNLRCYALKIRPKLISYYGILNPNWIDSDFSSQLIDCHSYFRRWNYFLLSCANRQTESTIESVSVGISHGVARWKLQNNLLILLLNFCSIQINDARIWNQRRKSRIVSCNTHLRTLTSTSLSTCMYSVGPTVGLQSIFDRLYLVPLFVPRQFLSRKI